MMNKPAMILTLDCIGDFRDWLSDRGLLDRTIRAYCSDVRIFFADLGLSSLLPSDLDQAVRRWLTRSRNLVAPATIRRRAASLREFSAWAELGKILNNYKMPVTQPQIPHPLPGLKDDLTALLNGCVTNNQRALVALLGHEGLRIGEALTLPIADIDVQKKTLRVVGKGMKVRTLPITRICFDNIAAAYIEAVSEGRKTIIAYSDRAARIFITQLGRECGIPREISSHDLRATFATLAYRESGNNIRLVQYWLGHSSIQTTQLYVGISNDDLLAAGEF